jgi:DNA (cytosine-5)-methyltransferase 1
MDARQSKVFNEPDRVFTNTPSPSVTTLGIGAKRNDCVMVESNTDSAEIEKRKLTIAELRRICAFPDDFILLGTYAQQWERLGRAVPPVMMSHIAATIRDKILSKQ